MAKPIRWGIMGTGVIAAKFAEGLGHAEGAQLAAVGSRSSGAADRFADRFGIPRRHASYEALANDPEIDVIYIATPHAMHKENALLSLAGGKAVLCEKPFTINATEGREVVADARRRGLFLMEAMWTRFFPVMELIRKWLGEGRIGRLRMVQASFGFRGDDDSMGRLLDPALGGGALLDVGIYPLAFASMVFGKAPESILSSAALSSARGVDEQNAMILQYGEGRMAVLSSAILTETWHDALVYGEEAMIRVHHPFWCPSEVTLTRPNGESEHFTFPIKGNGYTYEAEAVMNCLRQGLTEHPLLPLDESIQMMETMDRIRAQWGLRYPMEKA